MCVKLNDGTILCVGNDDGTGIWTGDCDEKYLLKDGDTVNIRICMHPIDRRHGPFDVCLDCGAVYRGGKWQ